MTTTFTSRDGAFDDCTGPDNPAGRVPPQQLEDLDDLDALYNALDEAEERRHAEKEKDNEKAS
jgi:hypothetical protein